MDKDYIIRKAVACDIDDIMYFISSYWSDTHILARSREFFEYQHRDENNIYFILALDSVTHEIKAILGYIIYGKSNMDLMLALWKSIDRRHPFLGVELLKYLLNNMDYRIVACCGINSKTLGIYQYLGYHIGKLDHYYRISDRDTYKVAIIEEKNIIPYNARNEYEFIEIKTFAELERVFDYHSYRESIPKPYKEAWYIEKRYFNHLVYDYKIIGIKNKNMIKSIIFARELIYNRAKILRIIDFIGNIDDLRFISYEIYNLLAQENYEYIDFYQHGISKEIMNQAGFSLKTDSTNMIPNYFEPFIDKNIDINYCTTENDDFLMFKGDGDQDRPNYYIPKEQGDAKKWS